MKRQFISVVAAMCTMLASASAFADLTPELQARVDHYKAKFAALAKNQMVVRTTEIYNLRPLGIDNQAWTRAEEDSPIVKPLLNNPASRIMKQYADDNVEKVFIRAKNGDIVAADKKPLLFNIANRPYFKPAVQGKPYNMNKITVDPVTGERSVVVTVPIFNSNGEQIGFVHSAIKA